MVSKKKIQIQNKNVCINMNKNKCQVCADIENIHKFSLSPWKK